jgi:predicted DCC family thiol-disulfide oxidoreductase YuxK
MRLVRALANRRIDSQAVAAFRLAHAAAGLFYVVGALQLVDVAWPAHQTLFTVLYLVWAAVLALLFAGFKARAMAIASFVLTLVCNSNPFAGAVGELMWRIAAFLLMFMRSGDAISIDELRARLRGVAPSRYQPRWPADLAVLSLGLSLFLSGLPKVFDPMWSTGNGFYLAILLPWTHKAWADVVSGSRLVTLAGNYLGILTESLFVFLVFVPGVRWLAIAAFAGLMGGFGVLMSFYFIGAAGISFLPLMLPRADGRWPWSSRTAPLDLLYDGDCGFCDRSVRALRAMDVAGRLRPRTIQDNLPLLRSHGVTGTAVLDQMHIVDRQRIYHGFYAFRRFAWTTPYLVALAPLLYVPGVPAIGERVYRAIAERRHALGCPIGPRAAIGEVREEAPRAPGIIASLFAAGHLAYILMFGIAATIAVTGDQRPLEGLTSFRPFRVYNRYTNDIRPLPLFCEVHLFGVFVYRLEGITPAGDTVELMPIFNERGGPGPCCVMGPRYLEGLMFHVTDDALRMGANPAYRPDAEHLGNYRVVADKAVRDAAVPLREVRMLIKLLDPPKRFEGRVAPWDQQRWIPWLRYRTDQGRVIGEPEWLDVPPRPSYTVRG